MDIIITVLSFAAMVCYVYRWIETERVVSIFKATNGNEYIKLDKPRILEMCFLWFLAIILYLATLKMMRILRFNRRVGEEPSCIAPVKFIYSQK